MILEDTEAPVVLSESGLRDRLPAFEGKVICLDTDWPDIARQPQANPEVEVGGSNLAYVMYTSGSTGRAKGTCIEHRSVVRLVKNTSYIEMGPKEVFLQFSPMSFDASTLELWGSLLNGGKLLICPAGRLPLEQLGKIIREGGVSTLWLTAGLFNLMVNEQLDSLRGVRQILAGGEALSVVHVRRLLQVIGEGRFVNGYGPTENTTFTCCYAMDAQSRIGQSVPIGRPITNTRVYVLDERRQPAPIGVAGELYVGGDGLAREYLNQPELTAEKFVCDPFSDQPRARLYRTGDLCRWRPDGNLEFLGRLDHQIKLRGFRIEPGEIEMVLAQHPKVQQAVVILREDHPGERRLVAYIVADRSGTPPTATDLRPFLLAKLPDYMVPSTFVILDELPLSLNGKLDRRKLPAPDPGRLDDHRAFVAPRTPTEERVAVILAELLGRNRVGVHDDFFELGGDSLLAIQAASRIRQSLGGELPLTCFFETPTLSGLVAHLGTRERTEARPATPPLVATQGMGASPLSCSQLSIWNLHRSYPDRVMSNTCRAHRLKGQLFPEAARDALSSLLERHEALRTNFCEIDGIPMQVVAAATRLEFPLIDLSRLPESQGLAEAQRLYEAEKQRRFDLAHDTMLRAMLIRLSADDHVLLLNLSHIVSDARSMAIFYREFSLLYDALSRGRRIVLPSLAIQPRDFARWEQMYLQGDVLKRQVGFWTKHLACGTWAIDPLSHVPGSETRDYASLRESLVVAGTFVDALQEVGRQEGCTLAMTLFALTNVLFNRFTGCEDILVGAPFAARTRSEIDELIGCFRKRVILRTDLSGQPTFRDVLSRVRDVWREAFLHQDVSLELVFPGRGPDHPQHWTKIPSFNFMDRSAHALELRGLNLTNLPLNVWFPATAFNMHLIQGRHDLDLIIYFRRALYSPATIRDFLSAFRSLMERLAMAPDERLPYTAGSSRGSFCARSAAHSHG
jgi:amino acid adenylation domain-containing protein